MTRSLEDSQPRPPRQDRLLQERVHDTYRVRHKLPEPTACPGCGAVYHQGRWQWAPSPLAAFEQMCPACRRIRDRYPGGAVSVSGSFAIGRREELIQIARNEEARAKAEHPLERIIDVGSRDQTILITTTNSHLARSIGAALHRAYEGELDIQYVEGTDFVRVKWSR
jgi:hypothetical protein